MSLRNFVPPPYQPSWSTKPGVHAWLSGSTICAKIFPTRVELFDCDAPTQILSSITFPKLSFSRDWTVFFDSMRQRTVVQGHVGEDFFRYQLEILPEGLFITSLKRDILCENEQGSFSIRRNEKVLLVKGPFSAPRYMSPRLFLGCNKEPHFDRISMHPHFLEILPLWYQMAQPIALPEIEPSLLGTLVQTVLEKRKEQIPEIFLQYFEAGIEGYFVPKKYDDLHLGYGPLLPKNVSASCVHGCIASCIRALFFQQDGSSLFLLPCIPTCVSGHLLRERLTSSSLISLEWRKERIRRVLIHAFADEELSINTHNSVSSFSVSVLGSKERYTSTLGAKIFLRKGNRYLLDNFV